MSERVAGAVEGLPAGAWLVDVAEALEAVARFVAAALAGSTTDHRDRAVDGFVSAADRVRQVAVGNVTAIEVIGEVVEALTGWAVVDADTPAWVGPPPGPLPAEAAPAAGGSSVLRHLSAALDAAGDVVPPPVFTDAGERCAEAWAELAEVTEGSSRDDVHEAVAHIGRGQQLLDEAAKALMAAQQALGEYQALITGLIGAGAGGEHARPQGPGPTGGTPGEALSPAPSLAERVSAAKAALPPGTAGSATHGYWVSTAAEPVALRSGPDDEWHAAAIQHARRFPPALRPAMGLARHLEVKFAMRMRQGGLTDETIVIDRNVCGTRREDRTKPFTCDKMMKWFLPPGARLTVIEPDGTTRTYQGRGTS